MACLDMHNSEQPAGHPHRHHHSNNCAPLVSPRISFSNDFADSQQASKQEQQGSRPPGPAPSAASSSDFEFSVTGYSMMSADELFFKGRLLPFKDGRVRRAATTTLREELLAGDDDDECGGFSSLRPPKGSGSSSAKWKGFLGLGKKAEKGGDGSSHRGVGATRSGLGNEGAGLNINSKELLNEGGSSCRDVEFGI